MKNKNTNINLPSTLNDAVGAFIYTIFVICILFVVHHYFGASKIIDTNITSIFGAILALSGLMAKQYLFKETIDYLTKWVKLEKLLEEVLQYSDLQDSQVANLIESLREQSRLANFYASYVKRELRIIPLIPIILVVLYGSALIAAGSVVFRIICMSLMLLFVTYLAKATVSFGNLVIEKPDLDETINELQELVRILNTKGTEHQL